MARHAVSFTSGGAAYSVTLPATFVGGFQFDIRGGAGAAGGGQPGGVAGKGGRVTGVYIPAAGDVMNGYVGGAGVGITGGTGAHGGGTGSSAIGLAGGGGAGGGSASLNDSTTAVLVAEAGGGGGGGGMSDGFVGAGAGGKGGAVAGAGGTGYASTGTAAHAGAGATVAAAGAGGTGGTGSGISPNGGNGVTGTVDGAVNTQNGGAAGAPGNGVPADGGGGGGGGGGYNGGGGGGGGGGSSFSNGAQGGAGGGGGSSFAVPTTDAVFFDGYQAGSGAVYLSWLQAPTCTPTGPTGTYTADSMPALTATYASVDGMPMQAYRVTVYVNPGTLPAPGPAPGLPQPGLAAVWDSGVVYASGTGVSVATLLPNASYIAYFTMQDAAGGDSEWSPWTSRTFVVAASVPATPTVAVAPLPASAQVAVTITPVSVSNILDAATSDLETGVGTWTATQGVCSRVTGPAAGTLGSLAHHGSASLNVGAVVNGGPATIDTGLYAVSANTPYSVSAWLYATVGSGSGLTWDLRILWYTAGSAFISMSGGTSPMTTTAGSFVQLAEGGTSPPTAAFARLRVETANAGLVGHGSWLDDVSLTGVVVPAYYTVQRSADGGITWGTCQGGGKFPASLSPVTFYDHGAPREVALSYRVQGVGISGADYYATAWTTPLSAYLRSDGHDWLMCAANPALDTPVNYKGPDVGALSHEDQAAYYPEGRSDAVVFHGTIHSESFVLGMGSTMLTFLFVSDADYANFVAMRYTQQPLLLKTVYGDTTSLEQFWLTLGADVSTTRYGGGNRQLGGNARGPQLRATTVAAIQVDEPG